MFVIEIEGATGDVLVGVFVIDAEGAMGMSLSGCLSLKLKVPRGCLRWGVCP